MVREGSFPFFFQALFMMFSLLFVNLCYMLYVCSVLVWHWLKKSQPLLVYRVIAAIFDLRNRRELAIKQRAVYVNLVFGN